MLKFKSAVIAAVAVGLSAVLNPGVSLATPGFDREVIYYSDASLTVEVGFFITSCHGEPYGGGERTPYYVVVRMDPCAGDH